MRSETCKRVNHAKSENKSDPKRENGSEGPQAKKTTANFKN